MLGIIGGMGPLASSLFYDMITEKTGAERDQDNLDLILLSHSSMPDRTAAILSGDEEQIKAVADKLLADAEFLKKSGCSAIAVTCNTAHYFVDMIEGKTGVPFVHMIRETAKHASTLHKSGKIAVLATDGTVKTRLYQKQLEKFGVDAFVPSAEVQTMVMEEIYGRVKKGLPADCELWEKIDEEIKQAGCDAALLACTELSVIKRQLALDDLYIDPMEVMAQRCVDLFRERGEI